MYRPICYCVPMSQTAERFNYNFLHGIRVVTFYAHESEHDAMVAFQMRFGYWPLPASSCEPYTG